jgi:hypothetical protein
LGTQREQDTREWCHCFLRCTARKKDQWGKQGAIAVMAIFRMSKKLGMGGGWCLDLLESPPVLRKFFCCTKHCTASQRWLCALGHFPPPPVRADTGRRFWAWRMAARSGKAREKQARGKRLWRFITTGYGAIVCSSALYSLPDAVIICAITFTVHYFHYSTLKPACLIYCLVCSIQTRNRCTATQLHLEPLTQQQKRSRGLDVGRNKDANVLLMQYHRVFQCSVPA